jgi:hypothetical protein
MSRCYALRIETKQRDAPVEVEYFVRSTVDELILIAKDAWPEICLKTATISEYTYDTHRKHRIGVLPENPKSRTGWQLRNDPRYNKYYQEYSENFEKKYRKTRSETFSTDKAHKYAKGKLFEDYVSGLLFKPNPFKHKKIDNLPLETYVCANCNILHRKHRECLLCHEMTTPISLGKIKIFSRICDASRSCSESDSDSSSSDC